MRNRSSYVARFCLLLKEAMIALLDLINTSSSVKTSCTGTRKHKLLPFLHVWLWVGSLLSPPWRARSTLWKHIKMVGITTGWAHKNTDHLKTLLPKQFVDRKAGKQQIPSEIN